MTEQNWHKSSYSGGSGSCIEVALQWRKSSHSKGGHQECVEVAHHWHKSSYSGGVHQDCVEVAEGPTTAVRDTRNRDLGHLSFPASEWAALLHVIRRG
ncbi:DUF397 domain-containing protein [Nocardiopsis suaedae]|uniref:DUF397 domain-containing protein n=1 Tax=Nocardiopsis suaedae TaxID=3018444 RepID=A0ABT4TLR7_9ACTN|nr:DUF397 domain-containing protein [Nocardiopsis suaedae]MDA2805646.1 DUF397 domain-containing protein [Nocardiopsis suaedae]